MTTKENPSEIRINTYEHYGHKEAIAEQGDIVPGMLIDIDGDGKAIKHADGGENVVPRIAIIGKDYERDIDDDYDEGESVRYHVGQPGEVFYMWLQDGENVNRGDLLSSNGDGTLQEYDLPEDTDGGSGDIHVNAARFAAREDVHADDSQDERIIVEVV